MTDALIVSNLLLWILVCVLGLVVLALTRQIGLLHERIAPVGALAVAKGPAVGDRIPELPLEDLDGRPIRIADPDGSFDRTLLFFLSPTCPVCATLLPTLRRMVEATAGRTRLLHASDGSREEHERFCREKGIARSDYILSADLGISLAVSKLPHAFLIERDGTIRARGLVNTREHVESLFEADRLDVASLQDFLEAGPRTLGTDPRTDPGPKGDGLEKGAA
ncbi:MAG TPA: methylamine dehydrogenase accessory protein MauD [Deltaproteobacteria bacterium]|nr:methylamine dehydrogenase accessory protein MauD [Deltaproteobacteria bacterium]